MEQNDSTLPPFHDLWESLRRSYDKVSPKRVYAYFKEILATLEHEFLPIEQYHPVMAIRTLITNFYNQARLNKFAKVIRQYFPTAYYILPKRMRELVDNMADEATFKNIEIQWLAYFIVRSFANTPQPKNRQKLLDPEEFRKLITRLNDRINTDMKQIFNEGDNNVLMVFDNHFQKVADVPDLNLSLFPLPGGDVKFVKFLENICKNTPFEDNFSVIMDKYKTEKIRARGGLNQFTNEKFMPELLPRQFIELLMDLYYENLEENLPPEEFKKFKAINRCFEFLLRHFFLTQYEEIPFFEFRQLCKNHGLSWAVVEELILSYSDLGEFPQEIPLPYEIHQIIYQKPLMRVMTNAGKQYQYDVIIFSWPLLFDAYLSAVAGYYHHSYVGKRRGKLLEDSISSTVHEKLFAEPFKIIVLNENIPENDPEVRKVFEQTKDYKYNRLVIRVNPDELGHVFFRFREYDVCFYFNRRLYFVETKDNISLDTFEQPQLSLKWLLSNLKRVREKEKLLKKPEIKAKLEQNLNLPVENVKGFFVSNTSYSLHRVFTFPEFENYLGELQSRLEYDEIRQKSMQILKGKIRQAQILRDFNQLGQALRQTFDLSMKCGLWEEAIAYGDQMMTQIDKVGFFPDKLLLSMQLADAHAHIGHFFDAIKVLAKAQYNINLKSEPFIGALYFFKRGQWLKELGKKEDALAAFLEAERISHNLKLNNDYEIVLIANIWELYPEDEAKKEFYTKKLQGFFPDEPDLKSVIHELVIKLHFL